MLPKAGVRTDFRRFEELNHEINELMLATVRGEMVDELPLEVTSIDRGKIFLLKGGDGVTDTLHVCIKNAEDSYELKEVTLT